jgi:hypothetical protein
MKKPIVTTLVVILLTLGLSVGCLGGGVTGSGNPESETFNFSDFTKVGVHNGFQVEITKSSTFSVEITTDDNVHEYIKVTKSGKTLEIGLEFGRVYSSVTLIAKITMPDLYELYLAGGSGASITGFSSSHDFEVELYGGSSIEGDITAGDAEFDLSGGSRVVLAGSADDLDVEGSGSSQLDLEAFSVNNADVELSGGSRATVNVNGTLDANLSGGSKVLYVGEPTLDDIDLSGGSTVSKK